MAKQPSRPADKAASKPVRERKRAAKPKSTPSNQANPAGPARDTRFQPGQSGNPNGRPRKDRSLLKLIMAELDAEMQLTEGTNTVTMTKREALAKTMVNNALKGDQRALTTLLRHLPSESFMYDDEEEREPSPRELMHDFLLEWKRVAGDRAAGWYVTRDAGSSGSEDHPEDDL